MLRGSCSSDPGNHSTSATSLKRKSTHLLPPAFPTSSLSEMPTPTFTSSPLHFSSFEQPLISGLHPSSPVQPGSPAPPGSPMDMRYRSPILWESSDCPSRLDYTPSPTDCPSPVALAVGRLRSRGSENTRGSPRGSRRHPAITKVRPRPASKLASFVLGQANVAQMSYEDELKMARFEVSQSHLSPLADNSCMSPQLQRGGSAHSDCEMDTSGLQSRFESNCVQAA